MRKLELNKSAIKSIYKKTDHELLEMIKYYESIVNDYQSYEFGISNEFIKINIDLERRYRDEFIRRQIKSIHFKYKNITKI